ncbi:DUF349 domain-containing protein [Caecibacteroides pullorum]|jgi:hypothetical protein|uniref:DUF349 domain-containing protein n=1 Tax=Caecibacteroides pullorum TaxID=2725562 RepID=A0AA41D8P6_9BACT|nr:DUF349 domain-containing protein [Caecibacteroides pullorum]MBM6856022.1 DUF349 domain-containing protein [Caecibacteroides pullorum]MBV8039215.1 DUF349 domain-containing protein [Caecibacteroides pullorum]MBV8057029.1 DUF349 domain-containing protein [Caecibacteroides pullorum]MDC6280646.1 DUF349 domain-containing protein [Caecibacteroides pullorum]
MTDTHDTNLPEKQVELEEEKKTVEVSETATAETPAEEQAMESTVETAPAQKLTKEEVIARLKDIASDVESVTKAEIDGLKQTFYKLHNAEQEAARKKFAEAGGAPEDYVPTPDPLEEEMKNAMSVIKNKRNELAAEVEKQKEMNLQVKLSIIEELKDLLESPEDANKNYTEFKRLQQQWNEVKLVPQASVNELWKNYQLYVEKFYDLLKLNNEFREYDFKKNLEIKTHLCEAAEKLAEETDVVSAFHQLQKLHQEFRETGPVAKELREEIWARFKAASTAVNRRHQQHFDALKEAEQQNLDQKTVICEIIEGIDYNELTNFAAWDAKTQEIIALQNKWKTIGYAPQKMNVKIFERFRAACDAFFNKKAEFFKTVKENMNENLEKKRALCEKAEALKDSTDWKATADTLVKLQKEWKTIGPVAKKHSDVIWKRFITACDYFFEQKNQAGASQRSEEQANLEKKRAIIAQLEAIGEETEADTAIEQVRTLMKEWNAVGFVPFKDKDKVYKQYHALVDKLFERYNISQSNKKLSSFKNTISNIQEGSPQALYREREKLMRAYDNMKSELQTYENNLGFLNAASKKGNSLLTELNRKVEKLKADIDLVKEKIKVIDESIQKEG